MSNCSTEFFFEAQQLLIFEVSLNSKSQTSSLWWHFVLSQHKILPFSLLLLSLFPWRGHSATSVDGCCTRYLSRDESCYFVDLNGAVKSRCKFYVPMYETVRSTQAQSCSWQCTYKSQKLRKDKS